MPPKAMTRSADRPAVAPRGGGTGRRVGRKGRRVREPRRRKVKPTGEPKGQGNDQGVEVNEGVDGVLDFSMIIAQQLQNLLPIMNVIVINSRRGCTYKEFLACNPKEYDGNGEEFCPSKKMQKLETELWNHAMVGTGHAAYTNRFHELARNRSLKKSHEKRGNEGEPSKDRNVRDDNKRSRTTVLTALAQKGMGNNESASIVLAALLRVLFFLSAPPFCCGVLATLNSLLIPFIPQN
nr:reverse transcriptase domain-containing protein [Tanacetum cinerariifolium]